MVDRLRPVAAFTAGSRSIVSDSIGKLQALKEPPYRVVLESAMRKLDAARQIFHG